MIKEKDIFKKWEEELLNGHDMESMKRTAESQTTVFLSIPCPTIYLLICEIRAFRDGLREGKDNNIT